ncbi:hypothetical protein B0J14DRAFT_125777 [Halenospora varia]|nr:hypothetical protein B0J14DRAFT_125777 [Halenospora varia]
MLLIFFLLFTTSPLSFRPLSGSISLVGSLKLQSDDSPRPRPRKASTTINHDPRWHHCILTPKSPTARKQRSRTERFAPSLDNPGKAIISSRRLSGNGMNGRNTNHATSPFLICHVIGCRFE